MQPTCPPQDALRRYLIGDYSDEQGDEIERHLSQCAACEDTLAGLDDTKDLLLRHLPLVAATDGHPETPESSSRPAWLDRLKAGLPTAPVEHADAVADTSTSNPISGLESYELLGIIGRGGMGVVYRARHRQLGREVAIKVVHPKLTTAMNVRDRFEREIRILGGMNHPGIVMATDAGRVGPAAYLVMELIEGIDLARLVREQGPLSVAQATEIARQVARALAAAHSSNAIHRDVKPSNVMLDSNGCAKLLDFGLAHLTERANQHDETSLGHVLGTLDYMAPEQAEGKSVQTSTDLYGLGALLFYLLTGQPPHGVAKDRTLLQQLKSITGDDPRPLTNVRADVPLDLSQLVAQLLGRDPAQRPKDASQVAKSLCSWAAADSLTSLTEAIEPQRQTDYDKDAVDRSLCALLGVSPTNDLQTAAVELRKADVAPRTEGPKFRNLGIAAVIAAGMALIMFGITLLLDTPTGQVQVKSEIRGVQVEFLDEQDRVTKLTVENNEKTTELKVGKYRVRILEPHDGVTLDKETLTLRKGDAAIATVRRLPTHDVPDVEQAEIGSTTATVESRTRRFNKGELVDLEPDSIELFLFDLEKKELIGDSIMRKGDVLSAAVSRQSSPSAAHVSLRLTPDASKAVLRAVGAGSNWKMAFVFDGETLCAPVLHSVKGDSCVLSGKQFTADGIKKLLRSPSGTTVDIASDNKGGARKPVQEPILPLRMARASELEFYLVDPESDARIGEPIIRGKDIWSVEAKTNPDNSTDILINLDRAAGAKLREVTSKNIGKRMAIVFEGKRLSVPTIRSAFGTRCQISGDFSGEEIERLLAPFVGDASKEHLGDGNHAPLYEGLPESFWMKRFEVERNPAAKIAAGEALLSFVDGSPAEQIRQRVEILGQLYEEAYGALLQDVVFAMSNNEKLPAAAWSSTGSLKRLRNTVSQQLSRLPLDQVAQHLIEMATDDSPRTSSYAMITLTHLVNGNPKPFVDAIIEDLDFDSAPTPKLRGATLMLRTLTFRVANDEQKMRLVADMEKAGNACVAIDVASARPDANPNQRVAAERDRKFERAWLGRVRKWKHHGIASNNRDKVRVKGVNPTLIAQMVLHDVLNNDDASSMHFYRHWATDSSPYQDTIVPINRDYSFPFFEGWVNVVNEWLAENDVTETKNQTLLKTYGLVLPTRREDDNWDTKEAARLISKNLEAYYQSNHLPTDAPHADELLTDIILCGGSFPDFVLADPPADPKIRKRLEDFREVVNSDLSYDEYVRRSAAAKGLIQVAPYHTVKCIITATKPPTYDSGIRVGPIRMIKDASDVKTEVYHAIGSTSHIPPINPLLLLAIVSELSKEHGAIVDYHGLKDDEKLFRRHLRDALRCPTIVGPIANRWYTQMARSLSDEKRKDLKGLAPIPPRETLESQ